MLRGFITEGVWIFFASVISGLDREKGESGAKSSLPIMHGTCREESYPPTGKWLYLADHGDYRVTFHIQILKWVIRDFRERFDV